LTNNWVTAAEELVAQTNTDRWRMRLLGNSLGGHIAVSLIERLEEHGMSVDRVALVSPSFYPKLAQKAKFGRTFPIARRHFTEFRNLPSYHALNRYAGQLLVSFSHHDSPPIHPEIVAVAEDAVTTAIKQGRGLSFFSLFVKHNFAPLNQTNRAQVDVIKTRAETASVVANFLGRLGPM
jgi:pimeloyl-ACP methyl ester carboxylesterase